jgi:hypothetical protein
VFEGRGKGFEFRMGCLKCVGLGLIEGGFRG